MCSIVQKNRAPEPAVLQLIRRRKRSVSRKIHDPRGVGLVVEQLEVSRIAAPLRLVAHIGARAMVLDRRAIEEHGEAGEAPALPVREAHHEYGYVLLFHDPRSRALTVQVCAAHAVLRMADVGQKLAVARTLVSGAHLLLVHALPRRRRTELRGPCHLWLLAAHVVAMELGRKVVGLWAGRRGGHVGRLAIGPRTHAEGKDGGTDEQTSSEEHWVLRNIAYDSHGLPHRPHACGHRFICCNC